MICKMTDDNITTQYGAALFRTKTFSAFQILNGQESGHMFGISGECVLPVYCLALHLHGEPSQGKQNDSQNLRNIST